MLKRFTEFGIVLQNAALPDNATKWSAAQKAWADSWMHYVMYSGTRPTTKPPL